MQNEKGSAGVVMRLSVMMFLQFFIWGAWYVSQTGFMNARGLRELVPWAYTVGPIAAIISPFFLGMVADRFFASQRVLAALHLVGAGAMLLIPSLTTEYKGGAMILHPYIALLMVHMLCYMPTVALTTSLSMHNLTNAQSQFPIVRVWGTIGWIAGNIVVGGNLKDWGFEQAVWIADGDKSPAQFYVTAGAGVLLALYALTLPHTPPPLAGQKTTLREILGMDALALLKRRSFFVFILCSFLICIPLAGYYNYARTYVDATGLFKNATLTMSYGQFAEIFFMLVMPLCFARLGVKWMLAIGMLAWVVRYGLFSGGAQDHVRWMVLGGIILHGICYDFFFVTGMIYAEKAAPHSIRGQSQGFLVLVTQGLGLGLGAQAFGYLVAHYTTKAADGTVVLDWKHIWLWPCLFAGVILAVFLVFFKDDGKTERAG